MSTGMDKLEIYLLAMDKIDVADSRLLRQIAYERLREAVRQAGLVPGDPLSETRLSKALGISRTPVREALQQLAQEGLVQIIPGRAITVAAPSVQEVLEAVHIRQLLEPELVRLVAESLSDDTAAILRRTVQEMTHAAETKDRAAWSKADTFFHETLSKACPNRFLGQLVLQTRNRIHYTVVNEQSTDNRIMECTHEHQQVAEAILSRDAQIAEQVMHEHLKQLRQSMFRQLGRY